MNNPLSQFIQRALLSFYRHAPRKLFQTAKGRRLFFRSYSLYKKYLEDPFTLLVKLHPELFERGTVLDIGANIGYTTVLFADTGNRSKKIYAFEPETANIQMLQQVIQEQQLSKSVVIITAAVGSHSGTIDLWINPNSHADHRVKNGAFKPPSEKTVTQSVQLISIDDFIRAHPHAQPVSFIKIDVQGLEEEVCHGMIRTLEANPEAVIAVEYCPVGIKEMGLNPTNLLNFFLERGYVAHYLTRKNLGRINPSKLDEYLGSTGYADLIYSKRPLTDKLLLLPD